MFGESRESGMSGEQDPHSDYGYDLAHELTIALRLPQRRTRTTVSVPAQVLRRELDLDVETPEGAGA
ncbi:hypothetical protein SAMN05216377_120110 [Pseudonocardia oroxyli]|uniref:Uncharacterized protein n=2 Tax=Pseudonocardia oroxyli TaxID=366584 RepID=A0A1G8ANW6_PSEOR|nr:hypothetical protein SAMN05216377_120110 [Pseudonocardia oroxyli]